MQIPTASKQRVKRYFQGYGAISKSFRCTGGRANRQSLYDGLLAFFLETDDCVQVFEQVEGVYDENDCVLDGLDWDQTTVPGDLLSEVQMHWPDVEFDYYMVYEFVVENAGVLYDALQAAARVSEDEAEAYERWECDPYEEEFGPAY